MIDEEMFRNHSENNIEAMEISASLEEYENMDFLQLQEWTEKHNIVLWSLHLLFPF